MDVDQARGDPFACGIDAGRPRRHGDIRSDRSDPAVTDQDGSFRLERLPVGARVQIRVESPGFLPWAARVPAQDRMNIVLARGSSIQGIVTDERGRPVEAAVVRIEDGFPGPSTARSNARGSFTLSGARGKNRTRCR
mgnify:CR=1 FL=1